jgi:hypothetical protein
MTQLCEKYFTLSSLQWSAKKVTAEFSSLKRLVVAVTAEREVFPRRLFPVPNEGLAFYKHDVIGELCKSGESIQT